MTARSERLSAFLAAGSALPFAWGERDCCLWVADWIKAESGRDPGAALRGYYGSSGACLRLLRRGGGLSAVVCELMKGAGFEEARSPVVGDAGLIETKIGAMGAICLGENWAVKSAEGVAILPAAPVKAWRI
ncbi:MAG TPA: hypothetical protein VGN91_00510 [Bosea sp. (in: a-proteobacteria)]|jgi:hypothetical protein|nr:hypothetical protein [Bosea sp. (in: a-proteobacteria)]